MSEQEHERDENSQVSNNDTSSPIVALLEKPKKEKKIKKLYKADDNKKSPMVKDVLKQIDSMIIGQQNAKKMLASVLTTSLAFDPSRKGPRGVLFLPGPTGVGKSEFAKSLFKILYGDLDIDFDECKIDCNNFTKQHEDARLKGAPPGYKGYGDKALLHPDFIFKHTKNAIKNNTLHPLFKNIVEYDREHLPTIILLDEFEKAHPDFIKVFYGILEDGYIYLNDGTKVDFRNTIFIMTSNIGAKDIQRKLENKGQMGFMKETVNLDSVFDNNYYENIIKESGHFEPEFIGRLDIIPFRPLTKSEFMQRLELSIFNHNISFEETKIRLRLTKEAKEELVTAAIATNKGGRSLIKKFHTEIVTRFIRLRFNGEVEKVEKNTGHPVKEIVINFKDGKFKSKFSININKKALTKELKQKARLEKRKANLYQQEVIVSLQDESMILTQRDVILPNFKYYAALLTHRDELDKDFENELKKTENILSTFGYQKKDFDLIKFQILEDRFNEYEESYNEMHLEFAKIKLWNEDDKLHAFSGMLRYIEKYMRNYFSNNKDIKAMLKAGAGTAKDIIQPIVEYAEKLISRELTNNEIGIITVVLHREYVKLNAIIPPEKQLPHKKDNSKKSSKSSKKDENFEQKPEKQITVNINFNSDGNQTSPIDRLKNLFAEDFEYVILAIKQNIANKEDEHDIIDIMNYIKISLEKEYKLTSNQVVAMTDVVKDLLKGEEIFKPKKG